MIAIMPKRPSASHTVSEEPQRTHTTGAGRGLGAPTGRESGWTMSVWAEVCPILEVSE